MNKGVKIYALISIWIALEICAHASIFYLLNSINFKVGGDHFLGGLMAMVSSSKRGIRESSICNLGFCLLQIGQVKAAKEVYEDVLRQYPENTVAIIQLRTINTISNSTESKIAE